MIESKVNDNLFYTCSLIEFIARETKNKRSDIVNLLGKKVIEHIFNYADIFHCEPIAAVYYMTPQYLKLCYEEGRILE